VRNRQRIKCEKNLHVTYRYSEQIFVTISAEPPMTAKTAASQLVTAQNRMTSWPAAEKPCCDKLTGASNAVLSLLWRV